MASYSILIVFLFFLLYLKCTEMNNLLVLFHLEMHRIDGVLINSILELLFLKGQIVATIKLLYIKREPSNEVGQNICSGGVGVSAMDQCMLLVLL